MPLSNFQKYMLEDLLLQGKFSDVTIKAFNTRYDLHKAVLARSNFFVKLFKSPNSGMIETVKRYSNGTFAKTGNARIGMADDEDLDDDHDDRATAPLSPTVSGPDMHSGGSSSSSSGKSMKSDYESLEVPRNDRASVASSRRSKSPTKKNTRRHEIDVEEPEYDIDSYMEDAKLAIDYAGIQSLKSKERKMKVKNGAAGASAWYNSDEESIDTDYTEVQKEVYDLDPDDPLVTKQAFELLLKQLYGCDDSLAESKIPYQMFATASYFGIDEVGKSATAFLAKYMTLATAAQFLAVLQTKDYGENGRELTEHCKLHLSSFGWSAGPDKWDDVPASIVGSIVGDDAYYVPNEYERALFIIRIIERREGQLGSASDIPALKKALNNKIHYSNMSMKQLEALGQYKDSHGESYIDPDTLLAASWETHSIRSAIMSSDSLDVPSDQISIPGKIKLQHFYYSTKELTWSKFLNEDPIVGNERLFRSTIIPPLRFSVTIPDVLSMDERTICYSEDFNYGGSQWKVAAYRESINSKLKVEIIRNPTQLHLSLLEANQNHSDVASLADASDRVTIKSMVSHHHSKPLSYFDRRNEVSCYLNYYLPCNESGGLLLGKNLPLRTVKSCDDLPDDGASIDNDGMSLRSIKTMRSVNHSDCHWTFDVDIKSSLSRSKVIYGRTKGTNTNLMIIFVLGLV